MPKKVPDYVTLCAFDFKRRVKCEWPVASNLKGDLSNLASPSFNRAVATRDGCMNVVTME